MTKAVIILMKEELWRDRPMFNSDEQAAFAMLYRNTGFTEVATLNTRFVGAQAAEEMFDLTNNPSRQDEREQLYGNGRSVSGGDIIRVDGVDYLCCSIGWQKLSA